MVEHTWGLDLEWRSRSSKIELERVDGVGSDNLIRCRGRRLRMERSPRRYRSYLERPSYEKGTQGMISVLCELAELRYIKATDLS